MEKCSAPLHCSSEEIRNPGQMQKKAIPQVAEHAAIILDLAGGNSVSRVAKSHSKALSVVLKWKDHYEEGGNNGLGNLPRGDSKDVYGGDAFREKLLETLKLPPPESAPYWNGLSLASYLDMPTTALRRNVLREPRQARSADHCRDVRRQENNLLSCCVKASTHVWDQFRQPENDSLA